MTDESAANDSGRAAPIQIAPPLQPPTCSTCVFWFAGRPGGTGTCRRHAPSVQVLGIKPALAGGSEAITDGFFPPTGPGCFCGEHPLFMIYAKGKMAETAQRHAEQAGQGGTPSGTA